MKTHYYLITLAIILSWTACANKNAQLEEAQTLSTTAETSKVEGYDVEAVAASVCTCLGETAKKMGLADKQPKPSRINLTKYKSSCEKKAFIQHGPPSSSTIKMAIQTSIQNSCGHLLNTNAKDSSLPSTTNQKAAKKKDVKAGKKEPKRPNRTPRPLPELVKENN